MERELRELTEILRAEKKVFLEYLEKLNRQQAALIENDLDGIKSTVEDIGRLARDAAELENGRVNVIGALSGKLGLASDDITVSKLLQRFRGPAFDELEKLKNTILEIHRKARIQKERNEKLIDQSMDAIKQTINHIRDSDGAESLFDKRKPAGRGALLTRTV